MKKYILFDLDGTLLPMDQDNFLKAYLNLLATEMTKHGYEPKRLIDAILRGTAAMSNNDGKLSNEAVFWDTFTKIFGEKARADEPLFNEFYLNTFPTLAALTTFNPLVPRLIELVKKQGYTLILATNPVFPLVATKERMRWAGLDINDFAYVTTYENAHATKPHQAYYNEILLNLNINPKAAIMIGNDTADDLPAVTLGVDVFLVTDCLINAHNIDISKYKHGPLEALFTYFEK